MDLYLCVDWNKYFHLKSAKIAIHIGKAYFSFVDHVIRLCAYSGTILSAQRHNQISLLRSFFSNSLSFVGVNNWTTWTWQTVLAYPSTDKRLKWAFKKNTPPASVVHGPVWSTDAVKGSWQDCPLSQLSKCHRGSSINKLNCVASFGKSQLKELRSLVWAGFILP